MAKKDYVDEITEYLNKNIQKGYSLESLKWALIGQGYSKIEVEKAMKKIEPRLETTKAVQEVQKPVIKYESMPLVEDKPFWKRWLGL